jgi:hypothetical protein
MRTFMNNIPRNEEEWVVKREQLGLDSSDGIVQFVDELTLRTMRPYPRTGDTDSILTFSLSMYGETAASMLLEAGSKIITRTKPLRLDTLENAPHVTTEWYIR